MDVNPCFICMQRPDKENEIIMSHNTKDWQTCYRVFCLECFGAFVLFKKKTDENPIQCMECQVNYNQDDIKNVIDKFLEREIKTKEKEQQILDEIEAKKKEAIKQKLNNEIFYGFEAGVELYCEEPCFEES